MSNPKVLTVEEVSSIVDDWNERDLDIDYAMDLSAAKALAKDMRRLKDSHEQLRAEFSGMAGAYKRCERDWLNACDELREAKRERDEALAEVKAVNARLDGLSKRVREEERAAVVAACRAWGYLVPAEYIERGEHVKGGDT